jgi:hypothetical protein
MGSVLSHGLPWWNLLENKQNFWQILVPSSLIILIPLVILRLLQRLRHLQNKMKQLETKVQMDSQVGETFIQQLRAMMALMQKAEDEHCAQLQTEIETLKELTKANERNLAQFENAIDLVKTIKPGDEHLAQLQDQSGLRERAKEAEYKRFAQMQKEMHSLKMMGKSLSLPTEHMVGDTTSMESLVEVSTPGKSYTAALQQKVSISKIPVSLVPLPCGKPVDSKIGLRDMCNKPGGSLVKMLIQKMEARQHEGSPHQVIQRGPTI